MAIFASGRAQQDIAREARIEPQKLSHVIYGRRELMPSDQRRVAKVLGYSVEELFPPLPVRPSLKLPKQDEVAS